MFAVAGGILLAFFALCLLGSEEGRGLLLVLFFIGALVYFLM